MIHVTLPVPVHSRDRIDRRLAQWQDENCVRLTVTEPLLWVYLVEFDTVRDLTRFFMTYDLEDLHYAISVEKKG